MLVAVAMVYPAEDTTGARDKRSGLLLAAPWVHPAPISTTVYGHPAVWPYVYPGHVVVHG